MKVFINLTHLRIAVALALAGLVGCADSQVSQVAEMSAVESLTATSIAPSRIASRNVNIESNSLPAADAATTPEASNDIKPFRNPFAPPKDPPLPPPVVEQVEQDPEPEPEPDTRLQDEPAVEIRQHRTPPTIHLLGFMNVGQPKVLVSFQDELTTLAIGDALEEMEVVKIESPELTMLFDDREIKMTLFDQAWRHAANSRPRANSSRSYDRARSARPPRTTSTSSRAPSGGPVPPPSNIPGFGPSDGRAPGFQPPASSGFAATPEGAAGNVPGLPGLGGAAGGVPSGSLPDLPGLDTGGSLPGGNLPGLPGLPGGP